MIEQKLTLLPEAPGCYLMKDLNKNIIYVGKAKNLKNRVKSYFRGAHNAKTTLLVTEIADFECIVTNSEQESLILELNLIKKHLPKYNIRLIDDKTYPYIEITKETHPRLIVVRERKKNANIFGPYPNGYSAREVVRLLNRLYPLRKCNVIPNQECLYYHMDQCLAPCINKEPIDYSGYSNEIAKFLKGDIKEVVLKLKQDMEAASGEMEYEKAKEYRDFIQHIETTTEKQLITTNDHKNRDFISFSVNRDDVAIQILKMRGGKILDNHSVVFEYVGQAIEMVSSYLQQFYENIVKPHEIILEEQFPFERAQIIFGSKAIYPKIGDKKKMLELAAKNAEMDLNDYFLLHRSKDEKTKSALVELGEIVSKRIDYIEVFDNANLLGTAPVSALIVYKSQQFNKKMYRKFHLRTTTNDDYQAMREVIYRRYQRLLIEGKELPDLIVVDGGKGQVSVSEEILLSLNIKTPVIGLKKDQKHTLTGVIFQNNEVLLDRHSEIYRFLVKLSDEVHRFAITFHRQTRQKSVFNSKLDQISGIGPSRKKKLLSVYASLSEISNASDEELEKLGIPKQVVKDLKEGLK